MMCMLLVVEEMEAQDVACVAAVEEIGADGLGSGAP